MADTLKRGNPFADPFSMPIPMTTNIDPTLGQLLDQALNKPVDGGGKKAKAAAAAAGAAAAAASAAGVAAGFQAAAAPSPASRLTAEDQKLLDAALRVYEPAYRAHKGKAGYAQNADMAPTIGKHPPLPKDAPFSSKSAALISLRPDICVRREVDRLQANRVANQIRATAYKHFKQQAKVPEGLVCARNQTTAAKLSIRGIDSVPANSDICKKRAQALQSANKAAATARTRAYQIALRTDGVPKFLRCK